MGRPAELDDAALVADFLSTTKAHSDLASRFANDHGTVDVAADDERHPRNWTAEHRAQLEHDRDALLALGERCGELVRELARRRLG